MNHEQNTKYQLHMNTIVFIVICLTCLRGNTASSNPTQYRITATLQMFLFIAEHGQIGNCQS